LPVAKIWFPGTPLRVIVPEVAFVMYRVPPFRVTSLAMLWPAASRVAPALTVTAPGPKALTWPARSVPSPTRVPPP